MLRSHFEFVYILYIIFISSVSSTSFGDFCSNDLPCHNPLSCSNSSKCICPISSSSFWNAKQNTCLFCPRGSMEWKNEKCLLFIAPHEGGVAHQIARNTCLTHSAQLLQINNHQDFVQFEDKMVESLEGEQANAIIEFLSNGVWINLTDSTEQSNSYDWCNIEYENGVSSWNNCIRVMKKDSRNDSDTSLCLSHANCNEKLPYICERATEIATVNDKTNGFANVEQGRSSFVDTLLGVAGSVLTALQPPTPAPEPPQPQIQIIPSPVQPQSTSSSNIILYVVLGIVVVLILCCLCGGGVFLLVRMNNKNSTMEREPRSSMHRHSEHRRTSFDSIGSDPS